MFMYFIKLDKQIISCSKAKRIPMLILKSLTEVQVLNLCSVEIGITYTNQNDKIDIWEISEVRIKDFTRKLTSFVWTAVFLCSVVSLRITCQETPQASSVSVQWK